MPTVDRVQLLGMMDMGMAHDMGGGGHDMAGTTAGGGHGAMPGMDHGGHGSGAGQGGMVEVKHPYPTERGVGNSMLPDVVSTRLDDPGIGLRNNGRRVLTYADLRSMREPADNRAFRRARSENFT